MRDERPGLTPDGLYWLSKRPGSDNWNRTWLDTGARQTRRASLGTSELGAAREALAIWWVENRRLVKERPTAVTLTTILRRYHTDHGKNIRSADQVRIAITMLIRHCGTLALSEFGSKAQRDFIAWMESKHYSAGYIRRTMGVAKTAFAWAFNEELITHAPNVIMPPDGEARDRVLSFDEVQRLWWSTEQAHERMYLALAFCTLGRPEALLGVSRGMVDLDAGLLSLNPAGRKQTKKFRPTVPIVDELRPWVESVESGPLVRWRGKHIASFKTAWRAMRDRAGLEKAVVPKTIRTTMATELRKEGVPEADIQGFLGHRAYGGKTEVYAKYRPQYLGQAAKVVNDYMIRLRVSCVATATRANS